MSRINVAFTAVLSCLFIQLAVVSADANSTTIKKVKVDVYYESLCPDSKKFIVEQLNKTYLVLSNYMDVNLIPFGNSTVDTNQSTPVATYTFKCEHGEQECYNNKIHACALNQPGLKNNTKLLFVACAMEKGVKDTTNLKNNPGEECAKMTGIESFPTIESCADNEEGSKYLYHYGEETRAVNDNKPLTVVPFVVVNGKKSLEDNAAAIKDLKSVVCGQITDNKPSVCDSSPKGAAFSATAGIFPVLMAFAIVAISSRV